MKKLVNLRAFLVIAVAFAVGIYAFYEFIFGDFYFGMAIALALVALCLFFVIKRRKVWKITLVALAFVTLGFGLTWASYAGISRNQLNGQVVTVSGRVADIGRNGDGSQYTFYLEDCLDSNSGERFGGRIMFNYGDESIELQTGDLVTLTGTVYSTYPVKSEVQTYYIRHSIRYEMRSVKLISHQDGRLKLDERIRKYIYEVTRDNMGNNSGVMYALLTGDRNAMSTATNSAFSRAGIVHLFAVSGLHVGFIVAIFAFVLRKFRLHPFIECAIVVVPLLLYAYVCGFSPSVVRAVTMVVCSYLAKAVLGRYDMLTSMSLSALLILIFRPFYLFDVGFQLSFLSVFGIVTVYLPIDRILQKRAIHQVLRRVLNALLLSLSCTFATVATVALHYGEVPVFGSIINLVAIPLTSVAFALGFAGLLPSFFHYLLVVSDFLLTILTRFAEAVAQLNFATVSMYVVAGTSLLAMVLLFVLGGFVNLSKLGKKIFYPICCFLIVLSIVFAVVPKSASNQVHLSVGDEGAVVAVVSDERDGAIVANFADYAEIHGAVDYLRKFRLGSCNLYFVEYVSADIAAVRLAVDILPVDKVYVLQSYANDEVTDYLLDCGVEIVYQVPNSTTGNFVRVQSVYDVALTAVRVTVGNIDICAVYGNEAQTNNLLDFRLNPDVYVLSTAANTTFSDTEIPYITKYQSNLPFNYGVNKYGNFTIKQKGDRIILTFR